jgi:hypothetical protein
VCTPEAPTSLDPADLRAALARAGFRGYIVAARAGVHPFLLTAYTRGRRPLTREITERIHAAIAALTTEQRRS